MIQKRERRNVKDRRLLHIFNLLKLVLILMQQFDCFNGRKVIHIFNLVLPSPIPLQCLRVILIKKNYGVNSLILVKCYVTQSILPLGMSVCKSFNY